MKMIEQWNIKPLLLPKASEYLEDLSDLRFAKIRGRFFDPEEIEKNKKLEKNLLTFVTLAESVC